MLLGRLSKDINSSSNNKDQQEKEILPGGNSIEKIELKAGDFKKLGQCTIEIEAYLEGSRRRVGSQIKIPEEFYKRYDDEEFQELIVNEIAPFLQIALRSIGIAFEEKGIITLEYLKTLLNKGVEYELMEEVEKEGKIWIKGDLGILMMQTTRQK